MLISQDVVRREMRKWWNEKDLIKVILEVLLGKELSSSEIVDIVYGRTKEKQ